MLNVNKEIFSFEDAVAVSRTAQRSVLLLRHSYRESLAQGNYDPGLTQAGWDYAVACGKFLKGMENVTFVSSSRKRTLETLKALICGAELENGEIPHLAQLHDTALFEKPENLGISIEEGTLPALLKEYYATGNAPGMRPVQEFVPELLGALTAPRPRPNVICCTHDIIAVALLNFYKVYDFTPSDWCGYVQGAFLYLQDEKWQIAYIVPDKSARPLTGLFV